jgi:hypothetical protein
MEPDENHLDANAVEVLVRARADLLRQPETSGADDLLEAIDARIKTHLKDQNPPQIAKENHGHIQ